MMEIDNLKGLLEAISKGELDVEEGVDRIRESSFQLDAGCAKIDIHRPIRNGFSEVIYGAEKTVEQIEAIVQALSEKGHNILGTRVDPKKGDHLSKVFDRLTYDATSRTFKLIHRDILPREGSVAICSGGTADIPVAEETYQTLSFFGVEAKRYYDVGVAGLHRLMNHQNDLKKSDIIIVIAGMEGALPSVVGGLFSQPIIAVPTSVGYGTNLKGLTTLFSILTSCSEGIVAVNIDNGFGAACSAIRILNSYTNKLN